MEEAPDSRSRQMEWEAFRSLALAAVRAGFLPETTRGERCERLFQIMKLPSFDAVTGWELFRITPHDAASSGRYIAARTRWDQKQDMDMFYHPVERLTMLRHKYLKRLTPTLTLTMQPLSEEVVSGVEAIMVRLLSTPVPLLLTNNRFGHDGTSYELAIGDFGARARFHWWEQAPPEWGFLQEIVTPLLNTLESIVTGEIQG